MLRVMTIFSPLRVFLPIAGDVVPRRARAMRSGRSPRRSHVTNSSVLLIMLAVVVLLVGLVSEQVAVLRADGRR